MLNLLSMIETGVLRADLFLGGARMELFAEAACGMTKRMGNLVPVEVLRHVGLPLSHLSRLRVGSPEASLSKEGELEELCLF